LFYGSGLKNIFILIEKASNENDVFGVIKRKPLIKIDPWG